MSIREKVTKGIIGSLVNNFDSHDLFKIENAIYMLLADYDITEREAKNTELIADISPDARAYQMFFVAKKIEGLSDKSLKYYACILRQFFGIINKPLASIITDDIRYFLATKQNVSLVTITNIRRVLQSFFTWLCNEEYITKNPVLRIKNIKQPKIIKKPFTQTEIEELRDACAGLRDRAIIELLLSTGIRCSELCAINLNDVDFISGEMLVNGKGGKQRICYLNAAAKKRLKDYLESRNDNSPAVFVPINKRGERLYNGGVQTLVRNIGVKAGVTNTHPHRFRRTAATMALHRGMPVEQVQVMLGHEKIDTTMQYAITADDTVKHSHARFM